MDGFVTVVAPEGKEKETLRLLLALADKARHVKIDNDEPGSYLVPEYLAEKYQAASADVADDEKPVAAPKRRGRPPGRAKAAEAADKDGEE